MTGARQPSPTPAQCAPVHALGGGAGVTGAGHTDRDDQRFSRFRARVTAGEDGTREGALVFSLVLIGGMVLAAVSHPLALTSFFVWFALLMLAISAAVGMQKLMWRLFHSHGSAAIGAIAREDGRR